MLKQVNRPFLIRYLKRDEILKEIQGCDTKLSNALGAFDVCIFLLFFLSLGDSR